MLGTRHSVRRPPPDQLGHTVVRLSFHMLMPNRLITSPRVATACVALLLAAACTLGAQNSATLDVSSSRLRYSGDTATSGAFTVAPALHAALPDALVDASAGLSQFTGGGWSAQGMVAGSAFTPSRPIVGELAGTSGGSVHADGNRTAQSLASLRLHVVLESIGAWAGGSAGQAWDSLGWHGVRSTEAGLWMQQGNLTSSFSLTPTRVADSIRYTDAQVALRLATARADLAGSIGRRGGDQSALGGGTQGWINASATLWLSSGVALTLGGGRYPSDPLQGYRPAMYGEIGLRFGVRDFGRAEARAARSDGAPSSASVQLPNVLARADREADRAGNEFELRPAGGIERTLRIRAGGAQRVEISGDFTGWRPLSLTAAAGGWWSATLPIAAGTYEMNFRVDGGPWLVPPGLTALADEDGGVVGVLVVPGG